MTPLSKSDNNVAMKKDVDSVNVSGSEPLDPLRQLRAWQRVHIRLTILYGSAIMLALAALGFSVYQAGVSAEVAALQKRLLVTVISLADSLDAKAIEAIPPDEKTMTPLHTQLRTRFTEVARHDKDIESIYVLRPTNQPTRLRFLIDFTKHNDSATPGEIYDASQVPVMLEGFARPSVEDKPYSDEWGASLSGYAPIMADDGHSVGIVGIDVKLSNLNAIRESIFKQIAVVFGIAIVLLGAVAGRVAHNVRTPLSKIIDALVAISRGDLNTRIRMKRSDELGLMGQHIDNMVEQLQEREFLRETFGRYVSEDVAKELLTRNNERNLSGEERVVTVLFCDMEGYSSLSEKMPPSLIVDMLNKYLSAMTDIVYRHHGCIVEFIGDAVFAVFGAPRYMPDHAEQAVRCAIAMHKHLQQLNRELREAGITRYWKDKNRPELRIRVGIHTGHVIAGNLGSATRMKYAVIGDTVNVAARLEALNKELDTYTLISRDVYTQLPEELANQLYERGEQQIKGREQSVSVYTLKETKAKLSVVSG